MEERLPRKLAAILYADTENSRHGAIDGSFEIGVVERLKKSHLD